MGQMAIVGEDDCFDDHRAMPLFYMNDFSILGLKVSSLDEALAALAADGHPIVESQGAVSIRFDTRDKIAGIFETLSRNGVQYQMTDLVSRAYQG